MPIFRSRQELAQARGRLGSGTWTGLPILLLPAV